MDTVLTLIASPERKDLTPRQLEKAREALRSAGAETNTPDWLAAGEACDITFAGLALPKALEALRGALGDEPLDIIVQPAEGRRKNLLIADMDSTIVTSETLDDLAAFAGIKEKIAAITARAMNGELDFRDALLERVGMLKGLSTDVMEEVWAETQLTSGAMALVATMKANGAYCMLVSGGFTFFTGKVREMVGFDMDQSNQFEVEDGKLTGGVIEPILDKDAKVTALLKASGEQEVALEECLSVGDGANDAPMLKLAGVGVAFQGKPAAKEATPVQVDHGDLTALLYIQGYRDDEIVWP